MQMLISILWGAIVLVGLIDMIFLLLIRRSNKEKWNKEMFVYENFKKGTKFVIRNKHLIYLDIFIMLGASYLFYVSCLA